MIDEGKHREATFWIITLVTEAYLVLQNDAPDAEKPVFAAQLQALLATLGYNISRGVGRACGGCRASGTGDLPYNRYPRRASP